MRVTAAVVVLSLAIHASQASECPGLSDEAREVLSSSLSDYEDAVGIMVIAPNIRGVDLHRFISSEAQALFFDVRAVYFRTVYRIADSADLTPSQRTTVQVIRSSNQSAWSEILAFYNDSSTRDQVVGISKLLMKQDRNASDVLLRILCR